MKRILSFFLIGLFVYSLIRVFTAPAPVFAEGWRDSSLGAEYDDADLGALNFGANIDRAVKSNMGSLTCMIVPFFDLCTQDPKKYQSLLQKSALVAIGNSIDAMYTTPPADLALWFRDTGQTLGFVSKQAMAQGVGFTGLQPLLTVWKVFRNIAYLILAIVMIIIGFMVMFRKKIDPKTVVTVQNALPRIVITLLLITFSYAIVGVMIDLMYLVIALGIGILPKVGALGWTPTVDFYLKSGFFRITNLLFNGGFSSLDDLLKFLNPPYPPSAVSGTGNAIINWVLYAWTWISGKGEAYIIEVILLPFLLALLLLFATVRIFFMALGAYIQVIIALLTAPLQILMDAFPGSSNFSSWFKNLVANLSVFPVTILLIHIGSYLAQSNIDNLWKPPLLNAPAPPEAAASSGAAGVVGLIGLGLLLGIPSMVNAIKEALKAKPVVPMFAGVGGVMTGGFNTSLQILQALFYLREFKKKPQEIVGLQEPETHPAGG